MLLKNLVLSSDVQLSYIESGDPSGPALVLLHGYTDSCRSYAKTMLVWGDKDTVTSHAQQLKLAAAIPGAELHVLRGVGHALHWEEPESVAALLTRFVEASQRIAA